MRVGIVYTSVTGNTEGVAKLLEEQFKRQDCEVFVYPVEEFSFQWIHHYDVFVIGTYTWGKADIPKEMHLLFEWMKKHEQPHLVTGVFGTGDRFFSHFCAAVDKFRDVLYQNTRLAVTLKVELFPQAQDKKKCVTFVEKCVGVRSS
ncbi:flavodoxin domain-containing protein [Oceanobacillus bengalensis]|uniref:Flavodoxin n=1 Tax=Oceanobacillus bengalensis TaxID=1435466 RepID=A0A494Z7N7_9BACI|nr:flavodoxin domain-containing protein [Oceanobacillus bengalensis]RKQ18630.1 flavodoxin [Oceanobacillus bengalensis]